MVDSVVSVWTYQLQNFEMDKPDIHSCDVLVVGSGVGGFATAITAAHHGLDVILTEKAPTFGGTTAFSAGVIWIPCSSHAREQGVEDSKESALTYLQNEVGNRLDTNHANAFLDNCAQMLDFLEKHSHVRYVLAKIWPDYHPESDGASPGGRSLMVEHFDGRRLGAHFHQLRRPLETTMILGGMTVARDDIPHFLRMTRSVRSATYVAGLFARHVLDRLRYSRGTRIANGNALIGRLAMTLLEQKVPLWLSSPVTRLVVEENAVVGAIVERDNSKIEVRAKRAVVLASGGFPANEALRARYYGHVREGKNHHPLPPATNTGDGIRMAEEVGAKFTDDAAHPAAWTPVSLVPQTNGKAEPFPHFIDRGKPGIIAVNRRGLRFVNEANSYHDFVKAMVETCHDDATVEVFLLADHRAIRRYGLGAAPPAPGRLGPHLRSGYLIQGADVASLAKALDIDAEQLSTTVERFNRNAQAHNDPDFGKGSNGYNYFNGDPFQQPNPCLAPLTTPPFYAVRVIPGDLGTFLGLRTDANARVLDATQTPIKGLYAVGNDMASFMGGNYPGAGITIGPAMTFGYIAARHIAGVQDTE